MRTLLIGDARFRAASKEVAATVAFAAVAFVGVLFPQSVFADTLFSDGFESGDLSNWTSADAQWSVISTTPTHMGTKQASVLGNTAGEDALVKVVSTAGFENISLSFWYKINDGKKLEADDHLYIQWSTDGGVTWEVAVADYTVVTTGGAWVEGAHLFPVAARDNPNFAFRFYSDLSAASGEEMRFDDVVLSGSAIIVIDVCENIDGNQGTVPVGYHAEGNQCIEDAPPPVDMCPNIDGVQMSVPIGYHLESENCIVDPPPPADVCPNIDGVQEYLPAGFHIVDGSCITDAPPVVDICANIDGIQETVPDGLIADGSNCVLPPLSDVCLNIDGVQVTLPDGYHFEGENCVVNPPSPVDMCPNVDGIQELVPTGFHIEGELCVQDSPPVVDVCPNIDGVQEAVPVGYHLADLICVIDPPPPPDVCANIGGAQAAIPEGYHAVGENCIENLLPPPVNIGSITICKVILDERGNVTAGTAGSTFTIRGVTPIPQTSQGAPVGVLPDTVFTTPLSYTTALFGSTPNAQCVTYGNLVLGTYYYGQEEIQGGGAGWKKVLYSEQEIKSLKNFRNLKEWSGELYDSKSRNDKLRAKDADGLFVLTMERPQRVLVVVNRERPRRCEKEWNHFKDWSPWFTSDEDGCLIPWSFPVPPLNWQWHR